MCSHLKPTFTERNSTLDSYNKMFKNYASEEYSLEAALVYYSLTGDGNLPTVPMRHMFIDTGELCVNTKAM